VETQLGIGVGAVALIVAFPVLLLGVVWLLGWLEAWMLQRDERAAVVQQLLEKSEGADEVEAEVTKLVAQVADRPDRISSGRRREHAPS
jgi:hypothetical protein